MNVGSLFTGVGGFDLGFERAGMRIVFQCEIDPWCRGILAQHWPDVPCYEDVRLVGHSRRQGHRKGSERTRDQRGADRLHAGYDGSAVDLLCGGSPCQDLSVAGKRAGLAGERSGLFFEYARVADELVRPGGWIVFENVPGLLSSNGGRDFAVVLRSLGDIGFYDLAWRVLDSRYFGVPQRRRRVFIVGRRAAGDGAREVLLEPESGGGNFAPGSQARPRVAASLSRGSASPGVSAPGRRQEDDANIVGYGFGERDDIASTLGGAHRGGGHDLKPDRAGAAVVVNAIQHSGPPGTRRDDDYALVAHTLRAEGFDASEDGTGRGTPLTVAGTVRSHARPGSNTSTDILCPAPDADGVRAASRLPGRVDDPQPDGPRYSAMGNAVSVPVLEWIGRRIMEYENRRER